MKYTIPPSIARFIRSFYLVALLFLSACGAAQTGGVTQNDAAPTNMVMPTTSPGAPAVSTAASVPVTGPHVTIANFTFSPGTLTVPVGATVTWINNDDMVHTVTSVDGVFKSDGLDTGDQFSYKFTKPGTYSYFCSIHPKMVGKIIVK